MNETELKAAADILGNPKLFAEMFFKNPTNPDENFKANYVQNKTIEAFMNHDRVVLRIARRNGKSYGLSVIALATCMVNNYYQVLIICPQQGQVDELFDSIQAFIDSTTIITDSILSITKAPRIIKFKNGSTIKGKTVGSSSNKKGVSVRSKGADLVIIDEAAFLNDGDYESFNAIIGGDQYRRAKVKVIAASTPREVHNAYYSWCMDKTIGFHEVHVSVLDNPDLTEDEIKAKRSLCLSEKEWVQEHLAEFPNAGENAFRNDDIDAALTKGFSYTNNPTTINPYRVMGVDWDKIFVPTGRIAGKSSRLNHYNIIRNDKCERQKAQRTFLMQKNIFCG